MRMRSSMALVFLVRFILITCSSLSSSNSNTNISISSVSCHPEERSALFGFVNSMTIDYSISYGSNLRTWKKGSDCCRWKGVVCHPTSHHVVELDLEDSGLRGTLDSNNTLFHLRHLRYLYLSGNDFRQSPISTMFCSSFPHLEELVLTHSNFSGEVPLEISKLSNLQLLDLERKSNDPILKMKTSTFHGIISNLTHLTHLILSGVKIDSAIPLSITNLSSLTYLNLNNCNLRDKLPVNVLNLPQLQYIYLGENHDLHAHFPLSNWSTSLISIDLSFVNFSSELPPSSPIQYQPSQLELLALSGCSFYGRIPDWVWNVVINNNTRLDTLDLSNNKFNGSVTFKDMSHNYLTGKVTSLALNNLEYVDLSNNMFNGPLPTPPIQVTFFSVSNNSFSGSLPSSLCNLTSLELLDLSNNNLKDEVPQCLGNLYNLIVLNLGSNNISGTFPDATFSNCSNLELLDLSNNWFEGLVPRLLTRCKTLEVLNLRRNKFLDEFPHWLGTSSHLRVLDLSNNDFFGPLTPSNASNLFPKLQVLDLSNNNLSGKIPIVFLERFQAMMNTTQNVGGPEYMASGNDISGLRYYYFTTLTFNGVEFKDEKIITTLATLVLSNNKFEGEIPNNIGKLVSLHGLNLSHNQLIGHIPPSLGNLISLNYLDLSSNKLTGKIPQELTSLSALGVFNVSENQLVGPIPLDNHFQTFPVDSYNGNLALCGIPLPECGEHGRPRSQPSKDDNKEVDEGMMSEWKVVMMGCGFGTFVSFVWGCYMLSIGRPLLLLKLVLILVNLLEKRMFGRRRRRPTRGRN